MSSSLNYGLTFPPIPHCNDVPITHRVHIHNIPSSGCVNFVVIVFGMKQNIVWNQTQQKKDGKHGLGNARSTIETSRDALDPKSVFLSSRLLVDIATTRRFKVSNRDAHRCKRKCYLIPKMGKLSLRVEMKNCNKHRF